MAKSSVPPKPTIPKVGHKTNSSQVETSPNEQRTNAQQQKGEEKHYSLPRTKSGEIGGRRGRLQQQQRG